MGKSIVSLTFYAVVIALVAWNASQFLKVGNSEEWTCAQYRCDKMTTADDWVKQNCFQVGQPPNHQILCKVVVNGQEQSVPLNQINTQTLTQCLEASCVKEVKARSVDYKVPLPQQATQQ